MLLYIRNWFVENFCPLISLVCHLVLFRFPIPYQTIPQILSPEKQPHYV
jgi:hypothetical protein